MINIESHFIDGANWQAQCVAIYLRTYRLLVLDMAYDKEKRCHNANIKIGRCENQREQGYIFTIEYNYKQISHFWVYEHRNSDDLCVVKFNGNFLNTPTIDKIPIKDKYDTTKEFSWGDVVDCGQWIIEEMAKDLSKYMEENNLEKHCTY
jgi:hypothetical protein